MQRRLLLHGRIRRDRIRVLVLRLSGQVDADIAAAQQALAHVDVPGVQPPDRGLLHLNQGHADSASEQFKQATRRFGPGPGEPAGLVNPVALST